MADDFDSILGDIFDEALESRSHDNTASEEHMVDYSPLLKDLRQNDNRYVIIEKVGSGGMKDIFCVYDNHSRRKVAMAVMKKLVTIEAAEAFVKEARLTACLQHPNIMPVHDVGISSDGHPFFIMKLIQGRSLSKAFSGKRPFKANNASEEALLEIFLRTCEAVYYAHEQGVLHLDLKPDNIQVDIFGQVLVCDWGLAKMRAHTAEQIQESLQDELSRRAETLYGAVKGTLGYMSPEQAQGVSCAKTNASDIYSLGAILYFILTGHAPFKGSAQEILTKTCSGDWIVPSKRFPLKKIPRGLEAIVTRAMAQKPADRYKTVDELRLDIVKYLRGYATGAEQAGFLKQIILLYQRNRLICRMIFFFLMILTIGSSIFVVILQFENKKTVSAVQKASKVAHQHMKLAHNAAPEFLNKATKAYENYQLVKAEENLKIALALNPDLKEARNKLAIVYLCKDDINTAYEHAKTAENKTLMKTCLPFTKKSLDTKAKAKLIEGLIQKNDTHSASYLMYSMNLHAESIEEHIPYVDRWIHLTNPNMNTNALSFNPEKKALGLANRVHLKDVSALRGLKIKELTLARTSVSDVSPLQQCRHLRTLNLANNKVYDLSPLVGLRLKRLNLHMTNVFDLSPLQEMPLTHLVLPRTNRINTEKVIRSIKSIRFLYVNRSNLPSWQKNYQDLKRLQFLGVKDADF